MKKLTFLFLIFSFSISFSATNNFEPKSNFWVYFIFITIFLASSAYFYFKSKLLSQDKQIAILFLTIFLSFVISHFLDSDYKKTQIEQYKIAQAKNEISNETKYKIEKKRRLLLQEKIQELEAENAKLKSVESNIKNNINSKENIRQALAIRAKIARLENDLLLIDSKINKINKGDYDIYEEDLNLDEDLIRQNLDKELSVIEKIKKRKEAQNSKEKFSLENKDINSVLEEEIKKKKTKKIQIVTNKKEEKTKTPEKKLSAEEIFLRNHYKLLENKKIKEAYENSSKKVSYNDYYSWYKNVSEIKINKIEKKSDNVFLVDLDITDSGVTNNYVVEKTLQKNKNGKYKIIKSKTLSTKKVKRTAKKETNIDSLGISSLEFKKLLNNKNYQILDIREDLEYKAGNIKNSKHIRLADLKSIGYEDLDKNKTILIYDWNGKKSKDATKFLVSKGFKVKFLKNGLKNLTVSPKFFTGTKNFFEKYNRANYKKIFDTKSVENLLNLGGVFLVDVREKNVFDTKKIQGSVNVPLVYLPKTKRDFYINKIPEKSRIITVCDSPETCFYAQVVGIEMEKRLYKFLGIYKIK